METAPKGYTRGYGTLKIRTATVPRVTYVEGLQHNLISVSQFCDNYNKVTFDTDFYDVIDKTTGKTVLSGSRKRNIYCANWN